MGARNSEKTGLKADLRHLSAHRRHLLLAYVIALVLLTLPAEVLSRAVVALLAG